LAHLYVDIDEYGGTHFVVLQFCEHVPCLDVQDLRHPNDAIFSASERHFAPELDGGLWVEEFGGNVGEVYLLISHFSHFTHLQQVTYHRHFSHFKLTTLLQSLKSRVCKGGQSRSKSKEPLLANERKQTPTKSFHLPLFSSHHSSDGTSRTKMPPERGTKMTAPENPALDDKPAETKQTDTSSQLHLERPAPTMSSEQTIRSDAEHSVDQLFTGPPLPGRNWSCEVEKYPDPSTKGKRAHFWLVDGDTERWFGTVALSAQLDMAAASRIALDIAHSANRWPVPVQDMSKAQAPHNLVPTSTARLILGAATKRQVPGPDILPSTTFHAEDDGYYIKWSASCIEPVRSQPWTFKGVISLCSATQNSTTSEPYIANVQFTTGARLLSVR
jgi:hypothetical protein